MTSEMTSAAPMAALRPAVFVAMNSTIPRNGWIAATIGQILLVLQRAA